MAGQKWQKELNGNKLKIFIRKKTAFHRRGDDNDRRSRLLCPAS